MLTEIGKLRAVRALDLPARLVRRRRAEGSRGLAGPGGGGVAVASAPHAPPLTLTLLAALVHQREREITDTLVELLIATVHRIGARAERRVTDELVNAFKQVTGKENILFSIAEAALAAPDGAVREVVFPAVTGGEQTLRELVHEFKTKGPGVSADGADDAAGLLHRPLPPRPDRAAGRAGVSQQQHRPPAGDRGAGVDRPVRQGRQSDLLPAR